MDLYLLKRTDEVAWLEDQGFVVAAASEQAARALWPAGHGYPEWTVDQTVIRCTRIGTAAEGMAAGILLCDNKGG